MSSNDHPPLSQGGGTGPSRTVVPIHVFMLRSPLPRPAILAALSPSEVMLYHIARLLAGERVRFKLPTIATIEQVLAGTATPEDLARPDASRDTFATYAELPEPSRLTLTTLAAIALKDVPCFYCGQVAPSIMSLMVDSTPMLHIASRRWGVACDSCLRAHPIATEQHVALAQWIEQRWLYHITALLGRELLAERCPLCKTTPDSMQAVTERLLMPASCGHGHHLYCITCTLDLVEAQKGIALAAGDPEAAEPAEDDDGDEPTPPPTLSPGRTPRPPRAGRPARFGPLKLVD